ncbi:hypothetical protein QBC38DRAFT_535712 [Podospora fimiseda]|uniref:Cupredoxin n=1 Tax=Podospora fimiseda TaxID=252190 RepID=A0AAN7BRX3_9PEZI|nr:hypothetical protein QBC38DRAFT_535712 [Podospora fimiseda]
MRFSAGSLALATASAVQAAHHTVTVGKGGLRFDPPTLTAAAGDTITYQFFARNHSVTQSSFNEPCQPLSGGFFSGFVPTESPDVSSRTTFTITVQDATRPIWLYCGQTNGNHCQSGMVQAINAPTTGENTFQAFVEKAKTAPTSKSPADGLPNGGHREILVDVGKNGLTFEPNNIVELPRTRVRFSFNPRNHSVVQSSFDNPCQPIGPGGFSSGHIPVANSPSGVFFDLIIPDTKPLWFYCGQTNGNHCQSGMVGSINAPTSGERTLAAFINKAKAAPPPSTIPAFAPLGGTVTVNGTVLHVFNGNTLPSQVANNNPPATSTAPNNGNNNNNGNNGGAAGPAQTKTSPPASSQTLPQPGQGADDYFANKAGGGTPKHWGWTEKLSDTASDFLQLHLRIEDLIANLLWEAYLKLEKGGAWHGVYPQTIVDTIGAWTAQAVIHTATTSAVLEHYQKPILSSCKWKLPLDTVDSFLSAYNKINLAQIGALIDISGQVATADPWVVPILLTQVGSKSRAAGVVNMMQNHMASISPREVAVPAILAWSYVLNNYVENCPSALTIEGEKEKKWPVLTVPTVKPGEITVKYDGKAGEAAFVAFIGPYGELEYSSVDDKSKIVKVPEGWSGDVFIVVTNKAGVKLDELEDFVIAGPELVWL